jgi:hypothetical protein
MPVRRYPEWAAKRARGNRIIAIVLFGLVALYTILFVVRYVAQ